MTSAAAKDRVLDRTRAILPASAAANRRGILAMLTAMAMFTGSDALVKLATAQLPTGQILATRGVFAVAVVLALVVARREHRQTAMIAHPRVLLRAAAEAATAFLFVLCVARLPLADITAVLQAAPIVTGLIVAALGLERIGRRRWAAIVVGFGGVLLIVRPSPSGFDAYALLTLVTAALVAVRDLITRSLPRRIPTTVVTLSTTLAGTGLGLALSAVEAWAPVGPRELGLLSGAALFVTVGNLCVVQAFRVGEVSAVSPFRYASVLTALLAGFVLLGEWPDALGGLGIALIVASGAYALHGARAVRPEPAA